MSAEMEKRGKIAEVMFELLDLSRAEQLLKDVWDKAPANIKEEISGLFAKRVWAHMESQTKFVTDEDVEKARKDYGNGYVPQKPEMQQAIEKQIAEISAQWLEAHKEQVAAATIKHLEENWQKKLVEIAEQAMYRATGNLRSKIDELFKATSRY